MTGQPTCRRGSGAFALLATLALLLPVCHADTSEAGRFAGAQRVVAFGDVHGAYDELVTLLQTTGVIDEGLHWTGGTTQVVSLGDLLDRGPNARKVLDLLMRLQGEALAAGGRLHVVLGNHDVMNLIGDLRYVSPAGYAAFAADETDADRAAAFAAFAAQAAARPEAPATDQAALRESFERDYPRGFFARQAAFAPAGHYGQWLLTLPAIIVVNDTAYLHGGPSRLVAEAGLDLNSKIHGDLVRYLELRDRLAAAGVLPAWDMRKDPEIARAAQATATPELQPLLAEFLALDAAPELAVDGPFWYRGAIYCKPLLEDAVLEAALKRLGVTRFVVGHTPTGDRRVRGLHDGQVVMLDTGMLGAYYKGRPAALVSEGSDTYVQYAMPAQRAAIDMGGSAQDYGHTEAELRQALEQGQVTAVERGADKQPWRVTLQHGDTQLEALFYPGGKDGGGDLELAAAALDDLLGTALIAPTVPRSIEDVPGALQLRYPGSVTEAQRVERGIRVGSWCPLPPQLNFMYAFDLLIANGGRSAENLMFTHELTDLVLTDHRAAFGTDRKLPQGFDRAKLDIPPSLADSLRRLDAASLEKSLGSWLDSRQIRALLARRDALLGG